MAHLLLTGAGFSRNFGGWLADEAFEYLLGCNEITAHHRSLLWKHRSLNTGFEGVLQELRDAYVANPGAHTAAPMQTFDAMLLGMFGVMNTHFGGFEPDQHERLGPQPTFLRDFLCRFDAIFTLNQDTLLEQKYQSANLLEGSQGRWFGFQCPGLLEEHIAGKPYATPGLFRAAEPPFATQDRYQPYFKLHGSSNWRAINGLSVLIMGDNKGTQIDRVPLLDWYRTKFRDMLLQPRAHLMVIGYSFRDQHINEALVSAVQRGLKLFIIDIAGVGVLDTKPGDIRNLRDRLQDGIIGVSRRPFPASVASDHIERSKILRFFPHFA